MADRESTTGLVGSAEPLQLAYDVGLLDLDGVVYVGPSAVPRAPDALRAARAAGMRLAFVTNNASRTPDTVAAHLSAIGVPAAPDEVVTSAQAAASLLAVRLPAASRVLVVGAEGLVEAVREAGLVPVGTADEEPAAVVQGYGPDVGWRALAEAAHAVNAGAWWVATNTDLTIPTPRGTAPGNGSLVAAVRAAVSVDPVVAGKPDLPLHREAVRRSGARRPLVVGDRLDTDIEGARRAGVDSLLVLTGVTTAAGVVLAPEGLRPTHLATDLCGLGVPHPPAAGRSGVGTCRGWRAVAHGGSLTLERRDASADRAVDAAGAAGDGLDALRAACAASWSAAQAPDLLAVTDALAAAGLAEPGRPLGAGGAAH